MSELCANKQPNKFKKATACPRWMFFAPLPVQLILPSAYSKFSLSGHTHSNTQRGPPLVGWQHAASELPSNSNRKWFEHREMCTIFCSRIFLGRYKEVQGGIPFDETCKQSLGRGGAKVEGIICKQLLSSLKAKFSSFIYFRFLIIISSSFFLFCILFHVSVSATFSCACTFCAF